MPQFSVPVNNAQAYRVLSLISEALNEAQHAGRAGRIILEDIYFGDTGKLHDWSIGPAVGYKEPLAKIGVKS